MRRSVLILGLLVGLAAARAGDEAPALEYGGAFELIDHHGKTVTDRDFLGKYMLLYFGYTYCPDVCPTTLAVVAAALQRMGEQAEGIQPIFVSVDSKRDTPQQLAPYVRAFHPRLIGLTGDKNAIFKVARSYYVHYYAGEINGEYAVGHTDNLYLVGPDGKFITEIPGGQSPQSLAQTLSEHLRDGGRGAAGS